MIARPRSSCATPGEPAVRSCKSRRTLVLRAVRSVEAAVEYVRSCPEMAAVLGSGGGSSCHVHAVALPQGRINFVYRVCSCSNCSSPPAAEGAAAAAAATADGSAAAGDGAQTDHGASSRTPPAPCVLLKYCPPFVRSLGDGEGGFPLTQERLAVEAAAQAAFHAQCPGHTPAVLAHDAHEHVLVQQYVHGHVELTAAMHAHGLAPSLLGRQLARFLASTLHANSVHARGEAEMVALSRVFANAEIRAANECVVLTDAWDASAVSNRVPRGVEAEVAALRGDAEVSAARAALLHEYRTSRECLLHHDLHPGNILVGVAAPAAEQEQPGAELEQTAERQGAEKLRREPSSERGSVEPGLLPSGAAGVGSGRTGGGASSSDRVQHGRSAASSMYVIDYEFATLGPMAYDVGCLLGNLLLALLTLAVADGTYGADRGRQRVWLLATIREFVDGFLEQLEDQLQRPQQQQQLEDQLQRSQQQQQQQQGRPAGGGAAGCSRVRPAGATSEATPPPDTVVARVWRHALGYAGLSLVRLTVGVHHYAPMDELGTERQRAAAATAALALARVALLASCSNGSGSGGRGQSGDTASAHAHAPSGGSGGDGSPLSIGELLDVAARLAAQAQQQAAL
ncbi:hypothetical protein FOA52_014768 [Chlamydomonas sp. UWO 241]|nr:hypothetical protein FOA52_014768 [Chlamydomonas sp. UWO 241]